jgi:arylsulfatase
MRALTVSAFIVSMITMLGGASHAPDLDRTVLPIREPQAPAITTLDARDAKAPPRLEVKPPDGAPNVVIVLIDDIGFGHSSAFGGPINMPTLERLASRGL